MPMEPSPSAETSNPCVPSLRCSTSLTSVSIIPVTGRMRAAGLTTPLAGWLRHLRVWLRHLNDGRRRCASGASGVSPPVDGGRGADEPGDEEGELGAAGLGEPPGEQPAQRSGSEEDIPVDAEHASAH